MTQETIVSFVEIVVGAIIMLFSILKSRYVLAGIPFIPEAPRQHVSRLINLHRFLMCFFFVGYIVVLLAFCFHSIFLSQTLVGMIFLFGALFVYMGIAIEARLLSEIQKSLRGLLPICAKCRKVLEPNSDRADPRSWTPIESYISARSDVNFTHGYCPECYQQAMREVEAETTQS